MHELVERVVVELLKRCHTGLPSDVIFALREGVARASDVGRMQLEAILENIDAARQEKLPMCQDTGIPVFYVYVGNFPMDLVEIDTCIREGVKMATSAVPLRPNAVHPLTRENSGDNTGIRVPVIHFIPTTGDYLELTVLPKGAGSENMSALRMLNPSDGVEGIKSFVLEKVVEAGGRPCTPTIVGVGIGGTADEAMTLAKMALLRPVDTFNPDPEVAQLESDLRSALYDIGIGPMGMGGAPSVIGVNVEIAHCHTASLPVGINMQCWAARRASARIFRSGDVEYLEV